MIDQLTKPGRYPHGVVPCVYMKVRPKTLSKDWVFLSKRTGEMGLGSWTGAGGAGMVSIAMAGKKGLAIHAQIGDGKDPRLEKKRDEMTFAKCATAVVDSLKPSFKNPKTEKSWTLHLTRHAAAIADKPVASITVEDILQVLKPLWLDSTETAKKLRGRLEKVLDWAKVKGYRDGENPARWSANLDHLLPKLQTLARGHHAAMAYADVPKFMARLPAIDEVAIPPLILTILTATRTAEVALAEWQEFDLDKALWTIPAGRTKSGKEHRVPLSKAALTLVASLDRVEGQSRLFPSLGIGMMLKALQRLHPDKTVHGFRSSFRDWAGDCTTFARETIEECLGHDATEGNEAEKAYRRSDALAKRRKVLDAWASYLTGKQQSHGLAFKSR